MVGLEQRANLRFESPHKGGAIGGRPVVQPIRGERIIRLPSLLSFETILFTVDNVDGQRGLADLISKVREFSKQSPDRLMEWRIFGVANKLGKHTVALFPLDRDMPVDSFRLSKRENQVVGLLANGLSCKEAAGRLGISCGTVRSHTKRIYKRAGVNTSTEAVIKAVRNGLNVDEDTLKRVPIEAFDNLPAALRETVEIIVADNSNPSITAKQIGLFRDRSFRTVRDQIEDLRKRTGARNKTQLAAWYVLYKTQRNHILGLRNSLDSKGDDLTKSSF